jgi:hypothetical protein
MQTYTHIYAPKQQKARERPREIYYFMWRTSELNYSVVAMATSVREKEIQAEASLSLSLSLCADDAAAPTHPYSTGGGGGGERRVGREARRRLWRQRPLPRRVSLASHPRMLSVD